MSLNFPPSPAPGEVFTSGGATFVWNGEVWATPGTPFPWARAADGAAGSEIDLVMTPEALDAMLDTFGPAPVPAYPLPLDVTAQRALAVNYQNDTGKPLLVSIMLYRTQGSFVISGFVGPANPASLSLGGHGGYGVGWWVTYTLVVPPGWWYRFQLAATMSVVIARWTEYRG